MHRSVTVLSRPEIREAIVHDELQNLKVTCVPHLRDSLIAKTIDEELNLGVIQRAEFADTDGRTFQVITHLSRPYLLTVQLLTGVSTPQFVVALN